MTWTPKTAVVASNGGVHSSLSKLAGASVSVGDIIIVPLTFGTFGGATSAVVDDDLGNTYVAVSSAVANDTVKTQKQQHFLCIVTNAGTPTIRARYNPVPGTSAADNCAYSVEPFTGSDSASTNDSNGAGQVLIAPGTGTDAGTSGNMTTTINGDLIHTMIIDTSSGSNPGSVGTGFTLAQTGPAGLMFKTAYLVQSSSGAIAGTWTVLSGGDRYTVTVIAINQAAGIPQAPRNPIISEQAQAIAFSYEL